jgi:hypothetical protein
MCFTKCIPADNDQPVIGSHGTVFLNRRICLTGGMLVLKIRPYIDDIMLKCTQFSVYTFQEKMSVFILLTTVLQEGKG